MSGIFSYELIAAGTSTAVKNNFGRNCWYRPDGTIIGGDVTQYFCSKVCNGGNGNRLTISLIMGMLIVYS